MNKKLLLVLVLSLFILGCKEMAIENVLKQEVNYKTLDVGGFSIDYPDWPKTEENTTSEVSVTRGFCTVIVNSNDARAVDLYRHFTDSFSDAPNILSFDGDEDDLVVISTSMYLENRMFSKIKIEQCNDKSYIINVVCLEEFMGYEEVQNIHQAVFGSAHCDQKELVYEMFEEDDFEIEYPQWSKVDFGNNTILGVSKGVCSVMVNKHNALPEDLYSWLNLALEGKVIESEAENDVYSIKYNSDYEDKVLISEAKMFYCNYQSYMPAVVCIEDEYKEEDKEIIEKVLESAQCKKEYKIPKVEITEEIKEQEPEVVEEIENEIVKTDAGEEFGIDAEAVVYFINSNEFFTKVMKDFPKANLVFEDDGRELKLRVLVGDDGKIISIEEGEFDDADVTLAVPLIDALNIFNNAANINPLNLLSFAVNVRTDPPEIKNEVIGKVLRGEYS